ncbi:hypothetical protein VTK73DRAFT_7787 [Phialemonium thermophilum]|uniref:Uncharacterized protein n=1 Tax=Phialemonium thermophilum TaxID=223376 RepID=A0ABR3WCN6_9PEZI
MTKDSVHRQSSQTFQSLALRPGGFKKVMEEQVLSGRCWGMATGFSNFQEILSISISQVVPSPRSHVPSSQSDRTS